MTPRLPIFLDLAGLKCLVVGAAAEGKGELLRRCGAEVVATAAAPAELAHFALVFAAGLPRDAAIALAVACRACGVPVNVADEPELCSFYMPALVERGPVTVAISTGGTSPALAAALRRRLDHALPRHLGSLAALLGALRPAVRYAIADPAARCAFWRSVLVGPAARLALAGQPRAAAAALQAALAAAADRRGAA